MCSMQIVFLFDLSSCTDFLFKPKEELNKKLLSVRLACLRLLTDFSSKSQNLKWGFKFFDSGGSKTQSMCKFSCSDVSLENFETLENELCVRYERHLSFLQALTESAQKTETSMNEKPKVEIAIDSPVKILHLALTQILCEFQWESMDMWSPSVKKIKTSTTRKRNYLFVLSDFKDSDEFFFKYCGLNNCLSKSKFLDIFLPQSLRDSLLKKSDIHLVLLNTCLGQKFMGPFRSKALPMLSNSLQAVQGSLIPLLILCQPLCHMKFCFSGAGETMYDDKMPMNLNLCSNFRNSVIPFSYLFEQSLDQPFYSTVNTVIFKSCIEFTEKELQLPLLVMEIFKKKSNFYEGSGFLKNKHLEKKKITWSKFVAHFAVPRNSYHAVNEMLLCLPNDNKSSSSEAVNLLNLNNRLCLDGIDLVLECITECGMKIPGMMTPLSNDAALIFILDPSFSYLIHEYDSKILATVSFKNANQNDSNEIQNVKTEEKNFVHNVETEKICNTTFNPFLMECLEPWFKPASFVSKVATHIESKSQSNSLKVESYWQLLKQSVRHGKNMSEKLSKPNLNNGVESSSLEKETKNLADSDIQTFEELPDLSYEEMLSAVKDIYTSAIELSSNIVTSAKRIVNIIVNYCSKHSNTSSVENDAYNIFKDKFLMTALKISEKYEMFESQEATQQKIKECQIQVLLILEIEDLRKCPDRSNSVSTVTSLLRVMIFYSGIEELQNFLHDVVKKRYSGNLYDILVEIEDELNISIFDDAESSNSPADTLSSELNNDDEVFGSVMSSVLSEKSTSSICSHKDNKDSNSRKLIRHRSDISDTSRYRQVLLPKSSSKKKKKKKQLQIKLLDILLGLQLKDKNMSVRSKTKYVAIFLLEINVIVHQRKSVNQVHQKARKKTVLQKLNLLLRHHLMNRIFLRSKGGNLLLISYQIPQKLMSRPRF